MDFIADLDHQNLRHWTLQPYQRRVKNLPPKHPPRCSGAFSSKWPILLCGTQITSCVHMCSLKEANPLNSFKRIFEGFTLQLRSENPLCWIKMSCSWSQSHSSTVVSRSWTWTSWGLLGKTTVTTSHLQRPSQIHGVKWWSVDLFWVWVGSLRIDVWKPFTQTQVDAVGGCKIEMWEWDPKMKISWL